MTSDTKDFPASDTPPPTALGHALTRDDARLEDLGYKPELKRTFTKLETFGGGSQLTRTDIKLHSVSWV